MRIARQLSEFGQVFDGRKLQWSTDPNHGQNGADGSVIPGALVVNPTVTILAQALKYVAVALP